MYQSNKIKMFESKIEEDDFKKKIIYEESLGKSSSLPKKGSNDEEV